jgi:hypothetical protein
MLLDAVEDAGVHRDERTEHGPDHEHVGLRAHAGRHLGALLGGSRQP